MKLRVAGAQVAVFGDIELNVETISNAIDFAIENGADILLTPEPERVHPGVRPGQGRAGPTSSDSPVRK